MPASQLIDQINTDIVKYTAARAVNFLKDLMN